MERIKKKTVGQCTKCKIKTKTHLHHKELGIRPKNPRSLSLEIQYVPTQDILYLHPEDVISNYLIKFNVTQSVKYYGVSWEEVIELCPKCHKQAYSIKAKRQPIEENEQLNIL